MTEDQLPQWLPVEASSESDVTVSVTMPYRVVGPRPEPNERGEYIAVIDASCSHADVAYTLTRTMSWAHCATCGAEVRPPRAPA